MIATHLVRGTPIGIRNNVDVTELDVFMTLRDDLARKLLAEAGRRKRPAVDLLADLIETAIDDNLFAAILDE